MKKRKVKKAVRRRRSTVVQALAHRVHILEKRLEAVETRVLHEADRLELFLCNRPRVVYTTKPAANTTSYNEDAPSTANPPFGIG